MNQDVSLGMSRKVLYPAAEVFGQFEEVV